MKNKKIWIVIILTICLVGYVVWINRAGEIKDLSYTKFLELVENKQIEEVILGENNYILFKIKNTETKYRTDHPETEDFKEQLLLKDIKINESVLNQTALMQGGFSVVIILGVFFIVFRQGKKLNFSKGHMALNITPIEPESIGIGFSQVAGHTEAKSQMEDLIAFMKKPETFREVGARMPKGVLFYGPPGTGKTLMAKALAKEAGVDFFALNGSDFMQMYVGVGAGRVREVFKAARAKGKAIIFIDEIDAIGKKRSHQVTGGNDEKDQTLNALLTEMSGFHEEDEIIVIGATNRLDILDDALLRPGRFDRHIELGYPDPEARTAILKVHLKDKPLGEDVSIQDIASETVYFTGAMLENLVNEAAILAANDKANVISKQHIDQAFYRVLVGDHKKDTGYINKKDRKITAYHEAGHALMTKLLEPDHKIRKVTITPTVKGAGGFSMSIPPEKLYETKKGLIHQIQIALGGRGAEELIFGEASMTTGASQDIQKATTYLSDYVFKYGMDHEFGCVHLGVLQEKGALDSNYLMGLIQEKMASIYEMTKNLLKENEEKLHLLAQVLLERESLGEDELNKLLGIKNKVTL